jgi:YfiH family protein
LSLDVLTSPMLELPGVRHAFFTRRGGVSSGLYESLNLGRGSQDDPAAVAENRRRAASRLGVDPAALLACYQIHSATAQRADEPWGDARPEGDAIVTATPGLACGALSADCAPVLLADAEARVVGAAHAGWKGALAGVVASAVDAMAALGARPERMTAVVGPCIGPDSYEVGPEFEARFTGEDPGFARYFEPGSGDRRRFDLPPSCWIDSARPASAGRRGSGPTRCRRGALLLQRAGRPAGEPDYGRLLSAIVLT